MTFFPMRPWYNFPMKDLTFRTIIQRDGKYYHGYVPALPGCHTQGKTVEETRKNIREAMIGYLTTLKAHKQPVPEDAGIETLETIQFNPRLSISPHA